MEQRKPKVTEYGILIKNIFLESMKNDTILKFLVPITILLNFLAAYFIVMATLSFSNVAKNFNSDNFDDSLKNFIFVTLFAAVFDYIPSALFTYYIQVVWRRRFVLSLNELLKMDYKTYYLKTPGEHQYGIFLRSLASAFSFNLIVANLTNILGSVFFGFFKIRQQINLKIALAFSCVPIFYFAGIIIYINYKIGYHFNLLEKQEKIGKDLSDKLLNYELIKGYNNEEIEGSNFNLILKKQAKSGINLGKYEAFSRWVLTFILNVPFVLIIFFMSFFATKNGTNEMVNFTLLYTTQTTKIKSLGSNIDTLIAFLNQIYYLNVLSKGNTTNEIENTTPIVFNEKLTFKNWSVFYGPRKIIDRANFVINKSEKVAIVGKNGTGKSTFVKSLLGFTESKGKLFVDNVGIKQFPDKEFLKNISYIPQEDATSDDSIINNILLGINKKINPKNPMETRSLIKKVRNICKKFNVDETFMAMENEYETEAGPRGCNLSSGEKQKIALIRACIKDAPIFIFDEATCVLDKKAEHSLVRSILENLKSKTIIMIVHGSSLLRLFDKIIFLDDSKVKGVGSYDHLLNTNPEFKGLYQ